MILKFLFVFLWLFSFNKKFLFWLYLWQLKEYHFGRFFDHFRTEKGKIIFLNRIFLSKALIILLSFLFPKISYFAFLFFFSESISFFAKVFNKNLKFPFFTQKIILTALSGILIQIFLISLLLKGSLLNFIFLLLVLDFLVPLFATLIVFLWHPFSYFWRLIIIRRAKQKIRKMDNLLKIGITGSYGKTSTKEFLSTILSEKYNVLKTKKHQNSEVGISKCILEELNEKHEVFVCEMGAYNKGGIKLLSDIVRPEIGILTAINEQHMATFGSQKNIIKTKFELIESLPEEGTAILNGDNNKIKEEFKKRNFKVKKKLFYSTEREADFFAQNINSGKDWISFRAFDEKGDSERFVVQIPGTFNVSNILASLAAASQLGMSLKEVSKPLSKLSPEQSGMKIEKSRNGMKVINATYSSNPNGLLSHLSYLGNLEGKKAIVMPCLIELGKSSKKIHEEIGKKMGEVCDLIIITTKERFEDLKRGVYSVNKEKRIVFLENYDSVLKALKNFSSPQNTLLLENRIPPKVIEKILDL